MSTASVLLVSLAAAETYLHVQRMLRHGCLDYLQKPYNIEALNHLVRSVLDSGL